MSNINKNIIMQAGAAVANATNKAAGLSASTPEPGTIISAIQLVNGGRTIGPDALAHFTESVRNKLLSLLVTMEPIQDFNGYGHPWPAGGGKNLYGGENIAAPSTSNTTFEFPSALPSASYVLSFELSNVQKQVTGVTSVVMVHYSDNTDYYFDTSEIKRVSDNQTMQNGTYPLSGRYYLKVANKGITKITWLWRTNAYLSLTSGSISKIMLETGTTPTDFAPYSNICPISGRTGLDAYVAPTSAIGDATAYSMDWTTPAGTIYGGSADVVSGDIKAAPYYASYNGETLVGPWVSSMDVYDPEGAPTTGAQVVDLGGTMTEYHITGQDIITLVGDNYIWSDSGDVTITE